MSDKPDQPNTTEEDEGECEELLLRIDSGLMAWLRAFVAGTGIFGDVGDTAVYLLRTALLEMMEADAWYGATVPHLPIHMRDANMASPKYRALERAGFVWPRPRGDEIERLRAGLRWILDNVDHEKAPLIVGRAKAALRD